MKKLPHQPIPKGTRVRLNEEWGRWSHSEIRKQLRLFRCAQRGWPVGMKATVVGGSYSLRCVRIIGDGKKTPTSFSIAFLDIIKE